MASTAQKEAMSSLPASARFSNAWMPKSSPNSPKTSKNIPKKPSSSPWHRRRLRPDGTRAHHSARRACTGAQCASIRPHVGQGCAWQGHAITRRSTLSSSNLEPCSSSGCSLRSHVWETNMTSPMPSSHSTSLPIACSSSCVRSPSRPITSFTGRTNIGDIWLTTGDCSTDWAYDWRRISPSAASSAA